ncbi:hypothetical protein G6F70_004258 [Rhizopus microsporus]|nr:hypothetical protein G6F71_004201 [Rhizopus microsporus]KAG1200211.1 hypothetical protein G6F70_004258 [Rhizopus microsporus]KAG1208721.1 hypothetical protein G6F69_006964 [Rhizopus microsporus]KAG1231678.1 hypothetical protein G6F67_005566 [Rhizopus microsporus]KAG1256504.1 hypothetical protein G6F68_009756 [Rhizopus microsporus]
MSDIYSLPYTNPIDSLILDPIIEPEATSKNDLSLWTNAQFTYDIKPPTAQSSGGDKSPDNNSSSSNSSPNNENMAYGYLAQVPPIQIDYAPMFRNITVSPENLSHATHHQPLLPKVSLDDLAKVLLSPMTPDTTVTQKPNNKPSKMIDNKEKNAVDEDKRRRNTAASARFRIKKKQREQNMQETVKQMTEKSEALQNRVRELEQEIKWLRGLLIEKDSVSTLK